MTNDGQNILECFQKTRKICREVGLLLQSQEAQMKEKEWNARSNTSVAEGSNHINYPGYWIPIAVFRLYKNKQKPSKLVFSSVLFDNHWEKEYLIEEPLITAGFFDYGNKSVDEDFEYSFTRIYGCLHKKYNWKHNGETFSFDRTMLPSNHKGNFVSGKVFALPLVSIKNDNDVKDTITNKLLQLLENNE